MKAIVQERYGAPERVLKLEEVDRPAVGADDVLIRVRATSVNTPDWISVTGVPYILRLRFGLRKPPTPVRGTDIAGVVEAVGKNVTDLQPGDEVFGSAWAGTLAAPGADAAAVAVRPAAWPMPRWLAAAAGSRPPTLPLSDRLVANGGVGLESNDGLRG